MTKQALLRIRSLPRALCLAFAVVAVDSGPAFALHDQSVHCRLTRDALRVSTRFDQAMLDLRLTSMQVRADFIDAAEAGSPASRFLPFTPAGLVMAGSILEDGTPAAAPATTPSIANFSLGRVVNHFQDPAGRPLTALGLLAPGYAAREWAMSGPSVLVLGSNEFSWIEAMDHYRDALLADTQVDRVSHAEHMLVAVGCNMHLLQDQTSPAHTRNDMHPPHDILLGLPTAVLGSSLLEGRGPAYIGVASNPFLAGQALSPMRFSTHAEYFDLLVADTNARFFSDDTVLRSYPKPDLGDVFADATGICALPAFLGEHNYRGVSPSYSTQNRLARHRWIPQFNNLLLVTADSLAGSACDTHGLDSVIHDNLANLVPTAVNHSAGLLDHFFRGRVVFAQEPGDVLRITNDSDLPPTATWNATFAPDPSAALPARVRFRVLMPDGSMKDVWSEPLSTPLAVGESLYIPNFAAHLPTGSTGLIAGVVENVLVGAEPGIAGAYVQWAQCTELCEPGTVPREETALMDCDGDLGSDFAIHRPFDGPTGIADAGSLTVYSGADCKALWHRQGQLAKQFFGARVVPIGDRNGDGFADLILQEQLDPVSKRYQMLGVSGRTGANQFAFDMPQTDDGPLAALGDIDGDQVIDFAVLSAPISIRSGRTGQLFQHIDVLVTDLLSVAADCDGDGIKDVLAERTGAGQTHQFTVFSSVTAAAVMVEHPSMTAYHGFVVIGDTDGDGTSDVVATKASDGALFSGLDGALISTFPGVADQAGAAGDFDGDGWPDFVLRKLVSVPPQAPGWSVQIQSGHVALVLDSISQPQFSSGMPVDFGDVNGDGLSDLAYPYFESQVPQQTCLKFWRGFSHP